MIRQLKFAALAFIIFLAACGASDLARGQKIMRGSVVALAQAPAVIVTLEAAGTITPDAAMFYREIFERLNTNLADTNTQVQALTPASTNREVVIVALRGSADLIGDLLQQIEAQHPNVRFAAALTIVRGLAQAALGYLESGTALNFDKLEQDQRQLATLMDAGKAGEGAGSRVSGAGSEPGVIATGFLSR